MTPLRRAAWVPGVSLLVLVTAGTLHSRQIPNPRLDQEAVFRNMSNPPGTVTAVGRDSITIAHHADTVTRLITDATGRVVGTESRDFPPQPPRVYGVIGPLAEGKSGGHCDHSYRISDVKVGDVVGISRSTLDGVTYYCHSVCIHRRPGGRIPPVPDGSQYSHKYDWHEYCQAQQNLEEKGIPYPEKFGPYRRFPVAPLPREIVADPAVSP